MNIQSQTPATSDLFAHGLRGLLDPDWIDFAVNHVAPRFSLTRVKARVVAKTDETADSVRIELAPNRNFRGHQAGQFVLVRPTIGGVQHERCYSLVSPEGASTLAIVVKRQPGGRVSNFLHDVLSVGDVLEIGQAQGTFCLAEVKRPLLLVAGGSGVTPVYSLAAAALAADVNADVTLLYYARTPTDFALAKEIETLRAQCPRFTVHYFVDRMEPDADGFRVPAARLGRFQAADLDALVPDVGERDVYVCGPTGLMDAVERAALARGEASRFHRESFGPALVPRAADQAAEVTFARSGVTATTVAPTLLVAAEEAGLRPTYGCRMGICHTCTCTKLEGAVRDRITGRVDDAPNSRIRLCISEPMTAVRIDL